jgi:hypothetical protein
MAVDPEDIFGMELFVHGSTTNMPMSTIYTVRLMMLLSLMYGEQTRNTIGM